MDRGVGRAKTMMFGLGRRGVVGVLSVLSLLSSQMLGPTPAHAHSLGATDPADPSSATALLVFRSAVARDMATSTTPSERLHWRELFDAKGEFRPESAIRVRKPAGGHAEHGHGAAPARR